MRIRPRPVASPPGRARGVFAGPAIGLPVSGGSMQTLRGGNRKRRFRAIGGKSGGKTESTSRKSRGNEMANSASIWDYGFRNGRNEAFRYERHVLITRRSSVRIRPPRPHIRSSATKSADLFCFLGQPESAFGTPLGHEFRILLRYESLEALRIPK